MCSNHTISKLVTNGRKDPTNTITLRNRFAADMKRRFAKITRMINEAIVKNDVFGLKENLTTFAGYDSKELITYVTPPKNAFAFATSQQKVDAFMAWLRGQVDAEILQIGSGTQIGSALHKEWTDMYVQDSYKRGIIRGRYEMQKIGMPVPSLAETGGISVSMGNPFHMDRVGVLYSRVFSELQGITATMDTQISRILSQGIADGDSPGLLARKLTKTITGPVGNLGMTDTLGRFIPAQRRATILARTEVIRAHHQGMIQEYTNWGVAGVKVQAEWQTAGDDRVCELCGPLEGKVYALEEIRNLIPRHPMCRCIAIPTMPSSNRVRQQASRNPLIR